MEGGTSRHHFVKATTYGAAVPANIEAPTTVDPPNIAICLSVSTSRSTSPGDGAVLRRGLMRFAGPSPLLTLLSHSARMVGCTFWCSICCHLASDSTKPLPWLLASRVANKSLSCRTVGGRVRLAAEFRSRVSTVWAASNRGSVMMSADSGCASAKLAGAVAQDETDIALEK